MFGYALANIEPSPATQDLSAILNARVFFRGQTIGKYRIVMPLGSGGFGSVYLAEDSWIDKKVALKVPHRQNLDFGELLREPRLLASMSHPNIVTVLTAEKQDNVFFIVMEYVPGDTLESIIESEGALDLSRALDYTCQICNAMDHAHRQGVIHRDLRPGNVLVTEQGMVKVADFGTSRFLEIAAHGTTVIGSPPYMAPEQFQGRAVFASDIYSLGVTMYQMLTGALPYGTPAPADIERLMRGELTTPPRARNSKIPKGISDIVMKAMAAEIPNRYQRAADVLDAVLAARAPRALTRTTSESAERRGARRAPLDVDAAESTDDIQARLKARETPQPKFCWRCRKALHARNDKCPFCGEPQ
jgi:serine/threonine protein kinase